MSTKTALTEILRNVGTICTDYSLGAELIRSVDTTMADLAQFRLKIPLMGGFNAGKSSLLNEYIGKNELLPTAIKAETAIASEIEYSSEEGIITHERSGGTKQLLLSEISNVTHTNNTHIQIMINAEPLQRVKDIVFVDMPGLDSDIQAHNQAIISYLNEGSFFLLLADIEHQVRGTILDFLRNEVVPLGFGFAVVLTKSDQKDPSELEQIRTTTAEQLRLQIGHDCQVAMVSAHDGNISEFIDLVQKIDIDRPVKVRYQARILELLEEVQRALKIKQTYVLADTGEIEKKIQKLQKNKQELIQKIDEESRNLDRQFSSAVIDAILYDVGKALQDRIDSLVVAAKAGESSFTNAVTGILRPALIQSSQARINAVLEASLDSIRELEVKLTQQNLNIDLSVIDKFKQVSNVLSNMKHPWAKAVLTSVALLTNFVGPWVELIIIFAPDLLSGIVNMLTNQDAKIKENILIEMIPQIQSKIKVEIGASLLVVKEDFLLAVKTKIASETQVIEETLQNVEAERNAKVEDEQATLANIDRGLVMVQKIIKTAQEC